MNGLSVVIIAYNEEKNIETVVRKSIDVLSEISDLYEVILVDDGSRDSTGEIIKSLASQNACIRCVQHTVNQGIGDSIRDGYSEAKYDLVSFLPADGQISPTVLKELYKEIQPVDFVTTVYSQRDDGVLRKIMSETLRALLRVLFGYVPRLDGVYMFRKKIFESVSLISSTFVLNLEFVIRAYKLRYSFKEIKIVCLPRQEGMSKVANLRKIFEVFREVIYLRIRTLKGYS